MEWTFNISPVAASRPRVSKWGAYYTGPYKEFKEKASEEVYRVLGTERELITEPIVVSLEMYVKQPKKTELEYPRGDVDNYVKAVFDAMNGKLWKDDSQIFAMFASKQWADRSSDGYFTLSISNKIK